MYRNIKSFDSRRDCLKKRIVKNGRKSTKNGRKSTKHGRKSTKNGRKSTKNGHLSAEVALIVFRWSVAAIDVHLGVGDAFELKKQSQRDISMSKHTLKKRLPGGRE
jgi:hypothetical protein